MHDAPLPSLFVRLRPLDRKLRQTSRMSRNGLRFTIVLAGTCDHLVVATQTQITASVIVMEMTRSQNMMFHLLAATLLASFVARQFSPRPFYHAASRSFRCEALSVEASASGQAARA